MKLRFTKSALISLMALLLLGNNNILAEGTRELLPTAASNAANAGWLQIWDNNDPSRNSMAYNVPESRTMNIEICNPGEVIYFGFRPENAVNGTGCNTLWYRIKDPLGNVVFGPQQALQTGAGSIGTYNQAVIGPNTVVGNAGGYVPLSYVPTMPGNFVIEFNRNNPTTFVNTTTNCTGSRVKTMIQYFDVTVADGLNGNEVPGRLWSRTWDVNVNSLTNAFLATMFVYADDGIVTGLNFNGIRPFGFSISCNRTGVANTGSANDRRSIAGNSTYAQYRIFLNNPDENCFPTGIFGNVSNITVTGCDANNRCINVTVDKAGDAQFIINLDGVPDYQPGGADILIPYSLVVGTNCIPWNGRDGLGNVVATGITLDARLDYFDGLTHLPLFDVENHPNGYIVSLVRPAGPQPRIFWDDRAIAGGIANLGGCIAGAPPAGCHRWSGTIAPNGVTPRSNWGDARTINSWWYANVLEFAVPYTVAGSISVDADTRTVGGGTANNASICNNALTYNLFGGVSGAGGGIWSSTGSGTFANPTSTLVNAYRPSATDFTNGSVRLILTSSGNGACPDVGDTLTLTFTPGPTVNAGPDRTVCSNNSTITLAGAFTVATGVQWSGGTGIFVPNATTTNATYTPSATEITNGAVRLRLTTTGNGICPAAVDSMDIAINAAPTVSAGTIANVCANNATAILAGSATNATTTTWSGGTGIFANAASLNTTYTPSAAERAAAPSSVSLTLTATRAGCATVTSNVSFNITPSPTVNAGPDRSICANDSLNISGTISVATGGLWSSSGTGTFTLGTNNLVSNYKPSASDISGGNVILTLVSTGNGTCSPVSDNLSLSFTPSPTISIGPDQNVCSNSPTLTFTPTITNATGVIWSDGFGTYTPSNTTPNLTYTLDASEITGAFASLVARTTGGTCPSVRDTVQVFVFAAPTIEAGPNQSVCKNNPFVNLLASSVGSVLFNWSSTGSGIFAPSSSLSSIYSPSAADLTGSSVTLTITANRAGCTPVSDNLTVNFTEAPTVDAGPNRSLCANNPGFQTLQGSSVGAATTLWTTAGDGTFSNNSALTPTYTPGANDILAGSVNLTLTANTPSCLPVNDFMTYQVTPAPTANAGANVSVCANNNIASLTGVIGNASGGAWSSSGTGAFGNINQLTTSYTPSAADITAGSVTLTLTTTGIGNCLAVTDNLILSITPSPTVSISAPASVCADNPTITFSASATVAAGVQWTGGSGTINSPNSLITTYTPSVAEITAGTVTLTATTTGNGSCNPVQATRAGSIAPAPTVNAGANQTVCGNISAITITGAVTGATGGSWSVITGTGSIANPTALSTVYNATAADQTSGTVIVRLTTTGNGTCIAVSDDIQISFSPVPSINAGPNQVVCTTEFPVDLNATGNLPMVWTGGGSFANANILATTYTPSAAEITAGTTTLTATTTLGGVCPNVSDQVVITIVPGPQSNAGSDVNFCGSLTSTALNGSVTNATGGFWSTTGTGSFTPDNNTLTATYSPSLADRTNGSVTLTLTTTGNGSCLPATDQVVINLLPPITANAGSDQTVCADISGITLNGAITVASGATWTSTGTGTFNNANSLNAIYTPSAADLTAGTFTLTLTTTGNGACPAVADQVIYTITPAPTVSAGPDQTICADALNALVAGSFTVAGGITWTTSGTGNFTPSAVNTNAAYVPSVADKTSGSVTLTITTTGNGTCLPVSDNLILSITPAPTLNAGPNISVCSNNALVTLNASQTVSTGISWTTSGDGVFGNATLASTTYTPGVNDISGGVVTLTAQSTGNGTCNAVTDQLVVSITPAPIVNAGFDQTICASSTANLLATVTNFGAGTWTSSGTGSFANASSLATTYTPSNVDTTAGSVTLTFTSSKPLCNAVANDLVLTLAPVPVVLAGPDQTICADSFFVALNGVVDNAGGGIWSVVSPTNPQGNFFPNTITLNANFVPSTAERTAGLTTLRLTSTSNGPCPAVSDELSVTITPAPTAAAGSDVSVCGNNANVAVNGSFTVAGGIQWLTSGTGTFANATNTATNYTPSALDIAAGTVTLTIRTTGNGLCLAASDQLVVSIAPTPVVNAGPDVTICADQLGSLLSGSSVASAGGGQWTTTGSGVFGPDATTIAATYFPSAADKTAGSITLRLTSTGNGLCNAVLDTKVITITAAPTVNAGTDATICADAAGTALNGIFTVAGGVQWTSSGTGSFSPNNTTPNATYIPSNADTTAGNVTMTLTTTGNGICGAVSDQLELTITPAPRVFAGLDNIICADADQIVFSNAFVDNASGGQWTTSGSGTFDPSSTAINVSYAPSPTDIGNGTIILTLTSTGNGLCNPVSDNVTLQFTPVPTLNLGPDFQVCNGTPSINISAAITNTTGITWSILSGTGAIANINGLSTNYTPTAADETAGSVQLFAATNVAAGCGIVTDDLTITFVAGLAINAGPDQTICDSELPVVLTGSGTQAVWSGGTGTFDDPNALSTNYNPSGAEAPGTVTLTLTTVNNGVCPPSADDVTITINPGPTVSTASVTPICTNVSTASLDGSRNAIAAGVQWTSSGTGSFDNSILEDPTYTPSALDQANGFVILTISSTGHPGCNAVSDTTHLIILPSPALNTSNILTLCDDIGTVNLIATQTLSANIDWSITTGTGALSSPTGLVNTYTLGAGDTGPSTVTLQLSTTGNGFCNAATETVTITLTPRPTVSANIDQIVCSDTAYVQLNGTITVATGGLWTSNGTGVFSPNNSDVDARYIPSPADTTAGTVTLTLETSGNGQCLAYTEDMVVTINPRPRVSATSPRTVICSGNIVDVSSTFVNTGGIQWQSTGTGAFSSPNGSPSIYTPSQLDIDNGGAILSVVTVGSAPCAEDTAYIPVTIVPSPAAVVNAGFDQIVCDDVDTLQLNGFIAVALGGEWSSSTGLGIFLPNTNDLNAQYIPDASDKVGGNTITVTLTSTGNGICDPTSDDMQVIFTPRPTINVGPDLIVCEDTAYVEFAPAITVATGGDWVTNGTGIFSANASTTNARYVLSNADISTGTIGFTLTTTGNGTCNAYSDDLVLTITTKPSITAGLDQLICTNSLANFSAVTTIATSASWTTSGTGTFNPAVGLSTEYTPSTADTASGSINLFVESLNNGQCKPALDTVRLNFQDIPVVFAGPDLNTCANVPTTALLNGQVFNAGGGIWSTLGAGQFSSPTASLNNTYVVASADNTAGLVDLVLTSDQNGVCQAVTDTMRIFIAPTPIVTTGNLLICETELGAALSGTVTNAGGISWSSSGTGSFSPNAFDPNATYFPSAADIAAGSVDITISSTINGTCFAESISNELLIEPLPIADAGQDQWVCQNGTVTVIASINANDTYEWYEVGVGLIAGNQSFISQSIPANTQFVLRAIDYKGCDAFDTMNVSTFTLPSYAIAPVPACLDDNLFLNSNAAPIPPVAGLFQWYRNGVIQTGENKTFVIPQSEGTYTIVYSYGSCANAASEVVSTPPQTISANQTVCNNATTTLSVTVTNATSLSYSWEFNGTAFGGNTPSVNITAVPDDTSVYYVDIQDQNTLCTTRDSLFVIAIPTPQLAISDTVLCEGQTIELSARPTNIPNIDNYVGVSYGWTRDGAATGVTDSLITINSEGVYVGTVTVDQCSNFGTSTIGLSAYPVAALAENAVYCPSTDGPITLDAITITDEYLWSTGNSDDTLRTLTVRPGVITTYSVTLTNADGCATIDSISVKPLCAPEIFPPNAFTPGVVGPNQFFRVFGHDINEYKIMIFNRWGEIIFESNDFNETWDGTYKGQEMPLGVYPVLVTYSGFEQYSAKKKWDGSVTLIR